MTGGDFQPISPERCVHCGFTKEAHEGEVSAQLAGVCSSYKPIGKERLEYYRLPDEATASRGSWTTWDPKKQSITVVAPREDGWTERATLVKQGQEMIVAELSIYPTTPYLFGPDHWSGGPEAVPPGGLTTRRIRIRLERLRKTANRLLNHVADDEEDAYSETGALGEKGLNPQMVEKLSNPRGRKPTLTDGDFARAAQLYEEAITQDIPPIPYAADRLHFSLDTVRGRIAEARKRGMLGDPPQPGVAGGRLTPRGRRILKECNEDD